jgi:hypothetical protein
MVMVAEAVFVFVLLLALVLLVLLLDADAVDADPDAAAAAAAADCGKDATEGPPLEAAWSFMVFYYCCSTTVERVKYAQCAAMRIETQFGGPRHFDNRFSAAL